MASDDATDINRYVWLVSIHDQLTDDESIEMFECCQLIMDKLNK
jgi:hypothetical protein